MVQWFDSSAIQSAFMGLSQMIGRYIYILVMSIYFGSQFHLFFSVFWQIGFPLHLKQWSWVLIKCIIVGPTVMLKLHLWDENKLWCNYQAFSVWPNALTWRSQVWK